MPRFDLVRHWPMWPGLVLVLSLASLSASSLQADPARDGNPKDEITWVAKAPMPTARSAAGIAALNGLIYVAGGTTSSNLAVATLEVFDPVANRWVAKASMPTARSELRMAALDGKLYAIGGATTRGPLNTVEEYNPLTDRWQPRAGMLTARAAMGVATVNGRIYVIGGWDGSNDVAQVDVYDPRTNTWTALATMPTPRTNLAVAIGPNDRIYAVGGYSNPPGQPSAAVEEYDPLRNAWIRRGNLPETRYAHSMAALGNGKLYTVGGQPRPSIAGDTVIIYDPATDLWTPGESRISVPRSNLGVTVVNDRLYAIGGTSGTVHLDAVEEGQLADSTGIAARPGDDKLTGPEHVACTNADIYFVLGAGAPGAIDYAYYQIAVTAKDGAELAEIIPVTDASPTQALTGLADSLLIDLAAGSVSISSSGTIIDLSRTLLDRISKLRQAHTPPNPVTLTWRQTAQSPGVRFLIHATRSGAGTVITSARWQRNPNDAVSSSWATPVCY